MAAITSALAAIGSIIRSGFGIDFGVFHAGGAIIRRESFEQAYDPDYFSTVIATDYFPQSANEVAVNHFISPPPFGWVMQAISFVPFDVAVVMWTILGIVAAVVGVRLLSLPPWVAIAVLVSPAMWINLSLGQTGAIVLVLFAGLHRQVLKGSYKTAGILAGLLILKPTLVFGYLVWWAVDRRHWKSIIPAGLVSGALVFPTIASGLGPWRSFLDAMTHRVEVESQWGQQSMSLPEFLKLLSPNSGSTFTLLWWSIAAVTGALLMIGAIRRWRHDVELLSMVAVLVCIWSSPHLLSYDTTMLVIPFATLCRRGVLSEVRAALLACLWFVSLAFGGLASSTQIEHFGRAVGIEFIAFVAFSFCAVRWALQVEREPWRGLGAVFPNTGSVDRQSHDLVVEG